jgi:nucleotide-binding universal stress UspA family protein
MSVAEVNTQLKSSTPSLTFRHILAATDFSESSRRVLREALTLAVVNNAQLSVIHVLHPDRTHAALENPPELDLERIDAEKQFINLLNECKPEQKIETLLKHGNVTLQVLSVIEEEAIDLLVIGTRARGGLTKVALGSVAEELLRVAPCPVMTIGPQAELAATSTGFHRILFATEFGKGSAKALPLVLALARAPQTQLIMLHMISPVPSSSASLSAYAPATAAADEVEELEDTYRGRAVQLLKECLPTDAGLAQEPKFVVRTDFPAEGILTASAKYNVDVIVMGANRTSSKMAARIPWSAVHEVARDARCPVLTVAG